MFESDVAHLLVWVKQLSTDRQVAAEGHPNTVSVCAVEEAIIALVRLHQRYTFQLTDKLLKEPIELKQNLTVSPKEGVLVSVIPRTP